MWQWVSDLAVTLAPVGVILGVLSGLLGVIYGVYRLRKIVLQIVDFFSRLLGTAQAAVEASSTAAESSRATEEATTKATDANADVHDSVVALAEAYGRTVTRLEEALALAQTAQQLLDSRVLRIEEHLAAAEVRRHRQREGVPE